MIEPTPNTVKYGPWSMSKADTAKNCPQKFYLTYLKKPKVKRAPNTDALIGNAVHKVVEYTLAGQTIDRAMQFALDNYKLTTNEQERMLGFRPAIATFLQRFKLYRAQVRGLEPKLEERLGVSIDWKPTKFFAKDVFFRGILDLSMQIKERPHVIIIDHKTGKFRDLTYYKAQFNAYMLLKRAHIPELTGAQVGINFLKDSRIDMVEKLQDVRDIQQLGDYIMSYLNEASANLHDLTAVQPNPLCGWCDFRAGCNANVEGASYGSKKQKGR